MTTWREAPEVQVPRAMRAAVGGHPLVAETLVRRGITDTSEARAFLDPRYYQPTPATELPDATRAAKRLEEAIARGERIWVWGDFDVDGQTAATLLVSTLRDIGAPVRFHIPHREREGHGIHLPTLRGIVAEGIDVLLTCDTGITAHAPIAYAGEQGVDVIVTDHHDLPQTPGAGNLPPAYALVDPKMLPKTHRLRELPGVGVAYKLAELLYDRAGRSAEVRRCLDLVALGIVADVATQTGDVRYLLQLGLEALRQTERLGLQALMEVAELDPQFVTEEHIGFQLAPRLNALGRLADATAAVEFFTTDQMDRARILAYELDGLNARRKMMCDQVMQAAEDQIEREPGILARGALVLSHPSWPPGIVGIVAGRVAEKYRRPTILIAAPPGELARGSARSIPGCDINAAIAAHADLLEGHGGHPMAAGLTIDPTRIPEFKRGLSQTVREICAESLAAEPFLAIDGYVPLSDLSLDFVEEIERLAPFGPGNPSVVLATRGLSLNTQRTVGRSGEHLKLSVEDEAGASQEVVWWRGDESDLPRGPFDLAYIVRASDYRGQRDVQVEWVDAQPLEEPGVSPELERPSIRVVDHRRHPDPQDELDRLRATTDVLVWSEGKDAVPGPDRYDLSPSRALAIWTTPPGGPELRTALARVSPRTVHLFAVDPGLERPQGFLTEVARLAKRALSREGGVIEISPVAAATAHREETVRAALSWLEAEGHVVVLDERDAVIQLGPGDGSATAEASHVVERLRALLSETAAYRAYVNRADANALIHNAARDAGTRPAAS